VMMLEHLGWTEAARLVHQGIARSIREGVVTYDLARLMKREGRVDVTEVSCSGFGSAVIERM
jgi:isocitrate dehydrogenase